MYEFQPPVTADAFYDAERTLQNMIWKRTFQKGKCLDYLKVTEDGPLFLFSGQLKNETSSTLEGVLVYFGVIYSTTDPTRSRVL